jgi:L-methionine (R)-S-oxide reductase
MIPVQIESALKSPAPGAAVLAAALHHFGCHAGTVHVLRDGALQLTAEVNIPDALLPVIGTVPMGKGIAGLAAERREPVSLCNLQTDESGQARPGAKATGMEGSLAVPMLAGGELRGVLGIARIEAHEWSEAEKSELMAIAAALAEKVH